MAASILRASQTLSGNGTVVFGNASALLMQLGGLVNGGTTLTIGPGITVRGQNGTMGSGCGHVLGAGRRRGGDQPGDPLADVGGGTITRQCAAVQQSGGIGGEQRRAIECAGSGGQCGSGVIDCREHPEPRRQLHQQSGVKPDGQRGAQPERGVGQQREHQRNQCDGEPERQLEQRWRHQRGQQHGGQRSTIEQPGHGQRAARNPQLHKWFNARWRDFEFRSELAHRASGGSLFPPPPTSAEL